MSQPALGARRANGPSPFLNYTTEISVDQTVGEIHGILRKYRARSVTDEYDEDRVIAVHFVFATEFGDREFRLPVNIEGVQAKLSEVASNLPAGWRGGRDKLQSLAQAERVAWRIVKDWLEAQMAILDSRQVRLEQVFLPYLVATTDVVSGRAITVYEVYRNQQLKMLTDGQS